MSLDRPDGLIHTYCYSLASVCEAMRKKARSDKRYGKGSACAPQPTAYCVRTSSSRTMSRQLLCSSTAESCQTQRTRLLARDPPVVSDATECEPTRNTDTYETYPRAATQ